MNQIKAGVLLSYLSILITIIIALLYTPIMVRLLGQSEYGLYSLIGSVAAYFSILDLGLGNTIVRYTARNRAVGDKKSESKLNGMFLVLYTLIGLLTVFVGTMVYYNVENIFGESLSSKEIYKAKIMVILLILNFSVSFPLSIFSSIIRAYEKFIVDRVVSILRIVMSPILTLPILFLGYGSVSMVLITTFVNLSCLLFNCIYAIKKLKIKFRFEKIDLKILKEILGYSFFVFLAVIVDQINWKTDQFILGILAGTVPVAIYAIAMQFIKLYIQFSNAISGLLLPKASIMVANQASTDDLTNLMVKYGRVQYIIIAYILSGFIIVGQPFIMIWAGQNYSQAFYITLIIMIPLTIPLVQNTGVSILYAKNLQGFRSAVLIFIAVLNIVMSIPLANLYSGIGTAIATAVSLTVGNIIVMNVYYHKKIRINMIKFWKNIFIITIPVLCSLTVGIIINYLIPLNTIVILLLKMSIFTVVYVTMIWLFGLNPVEKNIFTSLLSRFKMKVHFRAK